MIIIGIIICIIMCLLLIIGLIWGKYCRDEYGVYDPLYKTWFDYSVLNEEQENRQIPGSNRLADPPKGTKRQPPFWKEQTTLKRKILVFILMGNRPRPRGATGRNAIDDEVKSM